MKLQEQKQILCMLELYEKQLQEQNPSRNPDLFLLFSHQELVQINLWLYSIKLGTKSQLASKSREELSKLIGSNSNLVSWMIFQLEDRMNSFPKYTQEEVHQLFVKIQKESHYLMSKPVEQWDEYDKSNYCSILLKTGKAKRVYAIFTSDVLAEDVYAVTTQPSYFFDSKEEAKAELYNILKEEKFTKEELVIHHLWLLT